MVAILLPTRDGDVVASLSAQMACRYHRACLMRLTTSQDLTAPCPLQALSDVVQRAATCIQKRARGMLDRRSMARWREETEDGVLSLCTDQGRCVSVPCSRPHVLDMFNFARRDQIPALSLYQAMRSPQCHTDVVLQLDADARRIQRALRTCRARRLAADFRHTVELHNQEQQYKAANEYLARLVASETIQAHVRGYLQRKRYKLLQANDREDYRQYMDELACNPAMRKRELDIYDKALSAARNTRARLA